MDPTKGQLEHERPQQAAGDIRNDIRGTRRNMDETLDEISERLHPRHLLDELLDVFRGSDTGGEKRTQIARTSKEIGGALVSEIRERPLPALLVGAGVLWWIMDATGDNDETHSRNGRSNRASYYPSDGYEPDDFDFGPEFEGNGDRARGLATAAKDKAVQAATAAGNGLSHAGHQVAGAASAAGGKVADAASVVGESLSDAASTVGRKANQGRRAVGRAAGRYAAKSGRAVGHGAEVITDRFHQATAEHPLALGLGFLAAGMLTGLLLPRTEREDKWMGEASDELKDQTRQTGEELLAQGKSIVEQTASSALNEAEDQGLTPDTLAEKTGAVISAAIQAGKEKAREEGISPASLKQQAKAVASTAAQTAEEQLK